MKQVIFFANRRRSVVSVIRILFLVLLLSSHHHQIGAIATSSNDRDDSSNDIISSSSHHHLRGREQGDHDEKLTKQVQTDEDREQEQKQKKEAEGMNTVAKAAAAAAAAAAEAEAETIKVAPGIIKTDEEETNNATNVDRLSSPRTTNTENSATFLLVDDNNNALMKTLTITTTEEEEEEEDHPNNDLQQQQQTHRSLEDLVTRCFTVGPDGRYEDLEKKAALMCIDEMREGVKWNAHRRCSENPPSYSYTCGNVIHPDWSKCVNTYEAAHESCKNKGKIRAEVYDAYRRSNCDYGYMTFYCHPWSAPLHTGWTPCVSNADAEAWDKYNRDNFADYLCKNFYSGTGLTGRWEQCGGHLSEYFAFECSK